MDDDQATNPAPEVAGYSEEDAAQDLLSRWSGRQEAQADAGEQEDQASEGEKPEPEQADEEAQAPESEAAPEAETEWEVEFGGQVRKLPKGITEAVAKEVQDFGQSLHADYTRKTQEVAEIRKQIDAERQAAQELTRLTHEHADLVADWRTAQRQIDQISQQDLAALSESDPMTALRQQAMLVQLQQAQQRIGAQLQGTVAEMTAKQQASAKEALERATAELAQDKSLKWSKETAASLSAYGKSLGFNDTELAQVSDPRVIRLLHKAQQFDALQTSKPAVTKRVSEVSKTIKASSAASPHAQKRTQVDDAMKRLSRSGSIADAAAALLAKSRK